MQIEFNSIIMVAAFVIVILCGVIALALSDKQMQIKLRYKIILVVIVIVALSGATALAIKDANNGTVETINEKHTEKGGTILGDALPAKQYRTLHDAETAFGEYLGLHNKLESATDLEMVDIYIINNEIMQALYENEDATKTITVKLSKTKNTNELTKVYGDYTGTNSNDTVECKSCTMYKKGERESHLITVQYKEYKYYSIKGSDSLTEKELKDIKAELINNLEIIENK